MSKDSNNNDDFVDLGALWKRESTKGSKYYSGSFTKDHDKLVAALKKFAVDPDKYKLVAFPAFNKDNPKAPDISIKIAKKRPPNTKYSGGSGNSGNDGWSD